MTRYRTVLFAGFAAVGLALAGCGGGSDDGLSQSEEQQLRDDAAAEAATLLARIMELEEALGLEPGDDVGDSVADLNERIAELEAAAEKKRLADEAAAEEKRLADEAAANAAMAATAAKLYVGISAPTGDVTSPAATDRAAAYNTGGTAVLVSAGLPADSPVAVTLSEDKKTMVAAHHGWTGKRYADPAGDDMYEAMVYSNVGEPTMGKKFGSAATVPGDGTGDFAYQLTDGSLAIDTSTTAVQMLVASSRFDQSAGTKVFKKGDNDIAAMIPGSYHGVSGTYSCTPAAETNACSSTVAEDGFMLGGGTWTFKPGDANARVTSMPDAIYASYGWWIYKSADDKAYIASAFVDDKGDVSDAASLDALKGTATYMGGAAGKYALSSSTGGTNDAGHFIARATLEADFTDNSITGTIDNFMGADGMARDWSVELKEAALAATGGITRTGTGEEDNDTVWTIGGTAADASGEWSGSLQDNGDDGVPKVGTGTFYSEHGRDGHMVGAFGVNKQ